MVHSLPFVSSLPLVIARMPQIAHWLHPLKLESLPSTLCSIDLKQSWNCKLRSLFCSSTLCEPIANDSSSSLSSSLSSPHHFLLLALFFNFLLPLLPSCTRGILVPLSLALFRCQKVTNKLLDTFSFMMTSSLEKVATNGTLTFWHMAVMIAEKPINSFYVCLEIMLYGILRLIAKNKTFWRKI